MSDVAANDGPEVEERDEAEQLRDAYNAVVRDADLQAVQLLNISFEVEPAFFGDKAKRKLDVKIELGQSDFDQEKGAVVAAVKLVVSVKKSRTTALHSKAEYLVVYENLAGHNPAAVKQFVDRVAPFACYPYFRSVFATLDWAAGTKLPPLPVHKEQSRIEKAGSPF
ncbi:hypothetical protein [Devosia sp.]|uniref:hypothetical protein n=1 Tax=Devosia sp. TaxID=1871048 RepID=UPI001AD3BCEF|nr:hypothetical protein [Devosia sp.]MBN9335791.1 hypothetical protein [Devosia sp.]